MPSEGFRRHRRPISADYPAIAFFSLNSTSPFHKISPHPFQNTLS
ncbi:hypothetical protein EWP20_09190 [Neisseria meningitidis]|nr:hypothetical protein [Neisseria meningitidis]MBG8594168.1 hypothetical protein [Neisseria meningitidis]MBG8601880.1 hypothetical protein [Neisseria meningitidis]MBG8604102.1 hypothetical protein [Neisseria meningitidis]MBG8609710.1 hypothetical protein [Neisseria meningitidis]